jgi:hypothetical protein
MPGVHAALSPSSSDRWLSCPASVRMSVNVPSGPDSFYAREGTAAHALGELLARHWLLDLSKAKFTSGLKAWRKEYADVISDEEEMMEYADDYVDMLKERVTADEGQLLLEQRLPTGVANCWGTSDAVIVSPNIIEVIENNSQLRLYAIGALEAFGDLLGDVENVRYTVFQPRLKHIVTEEIPAAELRAWRDDVVIPAAELALTDDAPFGPSEKACRWCPVSGNCGPQREFFTRQDFDLDVGTLDDEDLADALEQIPGIRAWCDAVSAHALNRVYSEGKPLPGWKVVLSGGRRSVTDQEGALEALRAIGYSTDEVATTKIKGIGELEKLLKGDFPIAVGPFVVKSDGSPSLVPESDRRPAVNPDGQAQLDFA